MIVHNQQVEQSGKSLTDAKKALILLHGRGDRAQSFIQLAKELDISDDFVVLAIQAIQNTWYPYGFMVPRLQNEPQLTSSLDAIAEVVHNLYEFDILAEDIYFLGFSQGACLTLEYVARNSKRYGGVIAFTGGLIGEHLDVRLYSGTFEEMTIFIGSSDNDPHVPESRINESESVLKKMGAKVVKKIYPGMGHTINRDEIEIANLILTDNI